MRMHLGYGLFMYNNFVKMNRKNIDEIILISNLVNIFQLDSSATSIPSSSLL